MKPYAFFPGCLIPARHPAMEFAIRETLPKFRQNRLSKDHWFDVSVTRDVHQASKTFFQILCRKPMNVVLERIRNEPVSHPNRRLSVMMHPAGRPEQLIHRVVKVLVMRELDMATDIPSKTSFVNER